MKGGRLPQPATSPISKIWIRKYISQLKRLPRTAKKRIYNLLATVSVIDESVIEQIKKIIEEEINPSKAEPIVREFTQLFWQRGSQFAIRQLSKYGIQVNIPTNLSFLDEETVTQLVNLQLDLVKGLSEDIKKKMAYEIREGLLQGESIREIRDRIKKVANISLNRAELIARTESVRVFNHAAFDRYTKAGIKKWRWLAAMDERTCPICSSRHGKVFSSPADLPPHASHPRCRCVIFPVIESPAPAERRRKEELTEITGDKELDEKILGALNDFEKILKEEQYFSRALTRFVHGRPLDFDEAEKLGKEYIKKYFGRGGGQDVQDCITYLLPYRINPKVLEKAGKVNGIKLVKTARYQGVYNPVDKTINISKYSPNKARTFFHEFGHHLEYNYCTEEARKFFLARVRKHGYKLELLKKHERYKHLSEGIYHFEGFDHLDPYAGSIYLGKYQNEHYERLKKLVDNPKLIEDPEFKDNLATEMVSVGLEYFTRERLMKELWEKDRELFGFMLNVLRGSFK